MFKLGDKVVCIQEDFGNETLGKVYTVIRMINEYSGINFVIEKDDNGFENSYRSTSFKLWTYPNDFAKMLNEE